VLLAALVSIGVEAAQAVMNVGRLADVTDVMANTGGAAIGVVLWGMLAGEGPNERSA
jgi:glycopeptide antibiotics resistance protein